MISLLYSNISNMYKDFTAPIESINDLCIDEIINEISVFWKDNDLKVIFYTPLNNIDDIYYRQNIFKDLEDESLYNTIVTFVEEFENVIKYLNLAETSHYEEQRNFWFLYAAEIYCKLINKLKENLSKLITQSEGINKFKCYLNEYCLSEKFISLFEEVNSIKHSLSEIKYQVLLKSNSFTVKKYKESSDFSKKIEKVFEKFKTREVKSIKLKLEFSNTEMNHIEAKIIEFVSYIYPEIFLRLKNFTIIFKDFIDEVIFSFYRDIHFYLSFLKFISGIKSNGLKFCYPQMSNSSKEIFAFESFDLALAKNLLKKNIKVVTNNFYMKENKRVIIVTGPNQGGKTTFARMFGQLHYLASIGCPVAGSNAKLYLADNIFTLFEREENIENNRGKLEDDLKKIFSVLNKSTFKSILIVNEIFNSTTMQDMIFLSKKILEIILNLDAICVWVTFVDELSNLNEKIVSMTSVVDPQNPSLRTFKIIRRPPDSLAYALTIAEKYRLKKHMIIDRVNKNGEKFLRNKHK